MLIPSIAFIIALSQKIYCETTSNSNLVEFAVENVSYATESGKDTKNVKPENTTPKDVEKKEKEVKDKNKPEKSIKSTESKDNSSGSSDKSKEQKKPQPETLKEKECEELMKKKQQKKKNEEKQPKQEQSKIEGKKTLEKLPESQEKKPSNENKQSQLDGNPIAPGAISNESRLHSFRLKHIIKVNSGLNANKLISENANFKKHRSSYSDDYELV